jgi:hypothetical protein
MPALAEHDRGAGAGGAGADDDDRDVLWFHGHHRTVLC